MKRRYVSVIGPAQATSEEQQLATEVGHRIAALGAVLVCGGLGGVMHAAARGAHEAGGLAVGILPGHDRTGASPYLDVVVTTGIGEARNLAVVSTGDVVVAIGGAYGTLSEIGLAAKIGRPVILLRSWSLQSRAGLERLEGIWPVDSVDEAMALVEQLLKNLDRSRFSVQHE